MDGRRRTDDGPWLYYKFTNEPKGSGELIRFNQGFEVFNVCCDLRLILMPNARWGALISNEDHNNVKHQNPVLTLSKLISDGNFFNLDQVSQKR